MIEAIVNLLERNNKPFWFVVRKRKNNKKIEKVNSEEFVCYHEIIHHINSLKNNSKRNIDEDNFKLEIESK